MKRAALYLRVSTADQTVENQRRDLTAVAEMRGWKIVQEYADEGVSGAKGREGRPRLDAMMKDAQRRKFDVVMCWAMDRLGRSTIDLIRAAQHFEACGVDLYFDKQQIDSTTPMGKFVFVIFAGIAELERETIRGRVIAGIARAKAQGVRCGRPCVGPEVETEVVRLLAAGEGVRRTATIARCGISVVQRIKGRLAA